MDVISRQGSFRENEGHHFSDATLVPAQTASPSRDELACVMADALIGSSSHSRDEVMTSLWMHFPFSPLTVRITALGALARRQNHMPR